MAVQDLNERRDGHPVGIDESGGSAEVGWVSVGPGLRKGKR